MQKRSHVEDLRQLRELSMENLSRFVIVHPDGSESTWRMETLRGMRYDILHQSKDLHFPKSMTEQEIVDSVIWEALCSQRLFAEDIDD